ncbi:hypothetical protein NDU88_003675 [Pleurodeles waltl]|uniref:Uncharacterized protein n=1 Tax=Pleurodeles waltl TaxID=8319 RepID=A0AAV7W5D0_PLEWA|nr:hypothetical protein NDU88_003675 [Pleurodeles waltl]
MPHAAAHPAPGNRLLATGAAARLMVSPSALAPVPGRFSLTLRWAAGATGAAGAACTPPLCSETLRLLPIIPKDSFWV